jgi:hypothetical protein
VVQNAGHGMNINVITLLLEKKPRWGLVYTIDAKESNSADFCICHICKNLHMFPPSIMCGPNMVNLGCMVMEKLT